MFSARYETGLLARYKYIIVTTQLLSNSYTYILVKKTDIVETSQPVTSKSGSLIIKRSMPHVMQNMGSVTLVEDYHLLKTRQATLTIFTLEGCT